MHWPWNELGIAPTPDTVEIKRAYAKRLKTTRPDDDAAAYQRLREAYEAALQQARNAAVPSSPGSPPGSRSQPGAPVTPPAASASGNMQDDGSVWTDADDGGLTSADAPPSAAFAPPEYISPEIIAHRVYAFWEEHGDEALIALWPRVRQDLDALPLQWRAQASVWMATLVLDCPGLPPDFVKPLAQYFGWREDFRVAAMLGAERSQMLYEQLAAMGLRGPPSEAERKGLRHVQALARWQRQGRNGRARLLGMLMPEVSFRRWKQASQALLEAVGISAQQIPAIQAVLRWQPVLRGVGLFVMCMLLALAFRRDPMVASAQSASTLGVVVIVLLGSWVYVALLEQMQLLLPKAFMHWPARAPVVAAAAVALALTPDAGEVWAPLRFFGGWGLALLLPALAWPTGQRWSILLLPVSLALTLAVMPLLPEQPPLLLFVLAQVWTLAASVLLEHRTAGVVAFYRDPLAWLRPKHALGWVLYVLFFYGLALLMLVLSVICLPLSLLVSSLRHGPWAGFATLACAGVIAFGLGLGRGNDAGLLMGLMIAVVLMALVRRMAGRLADRLSH